MFLVLEPTDNVILNWSTIAPYIGQAIAKTRIDEEPPNYYELVRTQKVHVVSIWGDDLIGIMLIGIDEDWLHVYVLTGNLPEGWDTILFHWLAYTALTNNCNTISLRGRKGWIRKLKHLGFEEYNGDIIRRLK